MKLAWLLLTNYALAIPAIVMILRRRKEPVTMLAWLLAVNLFPFFGALFYFLIGDTRIERQARKRMRSRAVLDDEFLKQSELIETFHAKLASDAFDPRIRDLSLLATRLGETTAVDGNDVTIYHESERVFLALSLAIESAKDHVHLEYYIYKEDDTGHAVRDLLIRKVADGVRCRLLLDAVGSWNLSREFLDSFRDGGVDVHFFQPIRLNAQLLRVNCRNHRKLVIIDGKVGFMGSQNIGDEYLGRKRLLGPWRDTTLRIAGPAAVQLQEIFIEDWHFATQQDLSTIDELFPPIEVAGECAVQIFASGPERRANALQMVLHTALSSAHRSIRIVTPYFVPDIATSLALRTAALRGVNVKLLVPAKSDQRFVHLAGQSFYDELIDAGVEIYEYNAGMLHSKEVVVDDSWALVGSANMDIRSFRINFELTTLIYDAIRADQLSVEFNKMLKHSTRIAPDGKLNWTFGKSMALGVARLASPVL